MQGQRCAQPEVPARGSRWFEGEGNGWTRNVLEGDMFDPKHNGETYSPGLNTRAGTRPDPRTYSYSEKRTTAAAPAVALLVGPLPEA